MGNEQVQEYLQQQKQNILDSVKSLISTGKEQLAKTKAKELENHPLYREVIELFKSIKEDRRCQHCGEPILANFLESRLTWIYHECDSCRTILIEKAKKEVIEIRKASDIEHIEKIMSRCGVPKRFLNSKLEDFPGTLKNRIINHNDGLFISGPRGTGKTHLVAAIIRNFILNQKYEPICNPNTITVKVNAFIESPELPVFIPMTELLLEIRSTFKEGSSRSEMDVIERYSDCEVLILDDLGAEKTSDWVYQTLYTIIDRRYRDMRRTIITSNLSIDEVSAKFDDRIGSRIAGMCKVLELKGKDRRIS